MTNKYDEQSWEGEEGRCCRQPRARGTGADSSPAISFSISFYYFVLLKPKGGIKGKLYKGSERGMCPHGTEHTPVPVEKSNTTPFTCLPKITLKCFFQYLLYAISPEIEGEAWQLGRRVLG